MSESDTDLIPRKKMSFNANSALMVLITLLGGLCTWSINRNIDAIDRRFDLMMPRTEIEARLEAVRSNNNRIDGELLDVRTRLSAMELDLARIKRP